MAVFNQVVLSPDPIFLQPKSYDARADRKALRSVISPGVELATDYAVSVVSGLQLAVAGGVAYVLGQNVVDQGMYRQYIAATVNVNVPAHHATLPRIDQVIIRIMDTAHDSSGFSEGRVEVVPGAATAGANLTNRNGAANLATLGEASKSVLLLADILVPATSGALTIGDRRGRSLVGGGASAAAQIALTAAAFPTNGLIDGMLFRHGPVGAERSFWTFMYDATEDETAKWKCVGGPPMRGTNTITVPLSGDYFAQGIGKWGTGGSASPTAHTLTLRKNGTAVDSTAVDSAGGGWGGGSTQQLAGSVQGDCLGLTAGQIIDLVGADTYRLAVWPVRCF